MKHVLRLAGGAIALAALFVLGYGWRDLQEGTAMPPSAVHALLPFVSGSGEFSATDVYKRTYAKISKDYYRKIDLEQLKYASIGGLMASLGDPHTAFLDPKTNKEFQVETEGEFVGVGARLSPDPLGAKVVNVFENGPAFKAGLKGGDIITGVDGKSAAGTVIDGVVKRIRGKEGTIVKLTILRVGSPKPIVLSIRRAQVTTPTVETQVLAGTNVGYMSISAFAGPTTNQFDAGIDKLEDAGIRGLIVDLRNNPGGRLDTAVEMLSRFVESKVVIKMKMRGEEVRVQKTPPGFLHAFHYPIVLLLNEDSASAAEIFAGVLRDYKLATLVGEHSYGKASVQEVFPFKDDASAKITIARYLLPGGQDIGRRVDEDGQFLSGGIEPDVKVELNPDLNPTFGDMKTDSQLQKAVEVIKSKM